MGKAESHCIGVVVLRDEDADHKVSEFVRKAVYHHDYQAQGGNQGLQVNNSCRAASREPVNTSQTVSSICDREVNCIDSDHSSIIPIQNKGVCEPVEGLVPAVPVTACVEKGYITPQQVYNLLSAEEGQPALYDPYYILILDCRSAERYEDSHVVTARASVTVIHPVLGCLISCIELQNVKATTDSPDLQRCFFQLSGLGMDPVILLGGFSAFHALYPFLCTPRMVLLEPERHTLTIYPSEILEEALYQGSASQASNFRIIKNLHITHVVNATANCPDAFPNTLCYLRLCLSDDAQQDLLKALPLASRRACTAPNINFLRQLLTYEELLFGSRLTSLNDIR
ncbi:hypothetical protein FQN60_014844, partial [Etheostoma spectabile]